MTLRQCPRAQVLRLCLAVTPLLLLALGQSLLAQPPAGVSSAPGELALSRSGLPAGAYDVTFRLRVDRGENTVTPLATLGVHLGEYPNVIYKPLTCLSFTAADRPTDFTFLLDNFRAQDVRATVTIPTYKDPVPQVTVDRITLAPHPGPVISTVWPGKILYHTREAAQGMVAVCNGAAQPQTLTLRCLLESDLDQQRPFQDIPLTLAAGERREVPLQWDTGAEEYGFALAATLLDSAGKPLSRRREYFSVADNLWKVGLTLNCRGASPPSGPGPNRSLPLSQVKAYEDQLAAEMAKPFAPVYWSYSNYREYMGTTPDNFFNQAPAADYWYGGMGEYTNGKRWMQLALQWLHQRGMRATSYVLPGPCGYGTEAVFRRHPDWFVYDKSGQLGGTLYQKKLEVGSAPPGEVDGQGPWYLQLAPYALWLGVNISRPEPIDAFIAEVIAAQKMFGWDGIRFDVAPFIADGYDLSGRQIVPGGDPRKRDELEVAAWKRMRDGLWKALGRDFVIGLNSDRDLYHEQYPAEWDECCRQGQLLMEEVPRSCTSPQSPRNLWHEYMTFYHGHGDLVRALGGHHLVIGFDVQYPVDALYLHLITYAMRAHPYGAYASDELPLGNYSQFITRYSALVWDIDRVKPWPDAAKRLTVASPAPVWWQELACLRTAPSGKRQYVVHLINPPAQERIYTDPSNRVPAPQTNLKVTLKLAPGEKLTRAVLLSADPVTHEEILPLVAGTGQVSVTVPRLDFWSILVFA